MTTEPVFPEIPPANLEKSPLVGLFFAVTERKKSEFSSAREAQWGRVVDLVPAVNGYGNDLFLVEHFEVLAKDGASSLHDMTLWSMEQIRKCNPKFYRTFEHLMDDL